MSELSQDLTTATGLDPVALEPAAAVAAPEVPVDPVDALREQVGQTVLAHPGVLRLEPTLLGSVHGLRKRNGVDGVAVATHGRVVDLDVNLATRAERQARASVLELHDQLVDLVARCGFVPGTIEISVLAIEPAVETAEPVAG
ncbi:hypothetical protein [Microlunatus flavus]|uniref:Asp23 family, cell envelope-related function n=1 Tax=Microlunatus flavus TaxID=1036181 RepID=A0A1H9F263_9ACTN|nr:hypothetical protein [Microlunatus flavus]SEQ32005.1 hypothetical protein SAMN05421756_103125 [Microlunatus flavus]